MEYKQVNKIEKNDVSWNIAKRRIGGNGKGKSNEAGIKVQNGEKFGRNERNEITSVIAHNILDIFDEWILGGVKLIGCICKLLSTFSPNIRSYQFDVNIHFSFFLTCVSYVRIYLS